MYIMLYSIYYIMNAYTIYNLHIYKCVCSILAFYIYSIILSVQCIYTLFIVYMGFPGGASCKEPACQCRRHQRRGFNPWAGKIPWRRKWQPTLVSLPGKSHGQRSLAGYSPWGHKESDMTEMT